MKALEHRTKRESRHEMDVQAGCIRRIERLECHVDNQQLLSQHLEYEKLEQEKQETEDEALVKEIFQGKTNNKAMKRLAESDSDEESDLSNRRKGLKAHPTSQKLSIIH